MRHSPGTVARLSRSSRNSVRWVAFTYIGADQDVEKVAGEIGVCNALRFSANVEDTAAMFEKEGRSRTRFYDKVCCEMRAPDASLAESDDYFADDDTPEALEDILKSEAKSNR